MKFQQVRQTDCRTAVVCAASFSLSALAAGAALFPQTVYAQFPAAPTPAPAASPVTPSKKQNAMPAVLPHLSLEDQPFLRLNMKAHTSNIRSVVWSDDKTLATVGNDKTLRFWDAPSAQPLGEPVRFTVGLGNKGLLLAAATAPKGDLIAVSQKNDAAIYGKDNADTTDTILLYDRKKGEISRRIDADMRLRSTLAWSPDGSKIAAMGIKDGHFCQVRVWETQTGKLVKAFPKSLNEDWIPEDTEDSAAFLTIMDAFAWSPDGKQIATGNNYGTVRIFDAVSGKIVEERDFAKGRPVRALAWANDPLAQNSSTIVVGVEDQMYVWNKNTGQFSKQAAGNQVTALAFAPDQSGRILCGTGSNRTEVSYPVLVWDRRVRNSEPVQIGTHSAPVSAVSFSTGGNLAASADGLGHLVVWNPETRQPQATWEAQTLPLQKVRWLTRTVVDVVDDKGGKTVYGEFEVPPSVRLKDRTVRKETYGIAWTTAASPAEAGVQGESRNGGKDGLTFAGGYDFKNSALLTSPSVSDVEINPDHVAGLDVFKNKTGSAGVHLNNGPQSSMVDVVTQNGGILTQIALPVGQNALCAALVSDSRVLVGSNVGLALWDVSDATHPKEVRRYIGYEGVPVDVAISPDTDENGLLQSEGRYAAVTAADGTVRVFNLHDNEAAALAQITPTAQKDDAPPYVTPLLSVLPTQKNELVVWNDRTGVFYALGLGDEVVGWHTNAAKSTLAGTFRTARAMQESKFQPDVIRLAFEAGTMEKATRMATLLAWTGKKSTDSVSASSRPVEASLAAVPHIFATATTDGRQVDAKDGTPLYTTKPTVALRLSAFDAQNNPLTGVDFQVIVNRVGGSRQAELLSVESSTQDKEITDLKIGSNEVEVVAVSTTGEKLKSAPLRLTVHYQTGQPSPKELVQSKRAPNLYVLSIGIKDFPNLGADSQLRYTDTDAKEVADVFLQQKNTLFQNVEVKTLLNKEATRANIMGAVSAMDKTVRAGHFMENPDDLVVVYLSTHGSRNETGYYLLPSDVDKTKHDPTRKDWGDVAVNMESLATTLADLPARNVVLFMDQCYAGNFSFLVEKAAQKGTNLTVQSGSGQGSDLIAAQNGQRGENATFRTLREKRFVTLAASGSEQKSWEDSEWKHGAFTYALLQALRGTFAEARRKDGIVSLRTALPRIEDEVERIVMERKGQLQTPSRYSPAGMNGDNIVLTYVKTPSVPPPSGTMQKEPK